MAVEDHPKTINFSIAGIQHFSHETRITLSTGALEKGQLEKVCEKLKVLHLDTTLNEAAVSLMLEREKTLEAKCAELQRQLAFKDAELHNLRGVRINKQ